MPEAVDVVDAQLAAFRARDLERFLSFYVADIAIKDFDGHVVMDGLDALQVQYGALFINSPNLRATIANRMAIGDFVVDEEWLDGFVIPGYPTELHAVMVYRVSEGLIRAVTMLSG